MRIAVLGATGPTGIQVVQEALERGHDVIALVRNPEGLGDIKHDKLQIQKVDIFQEKDLSPHLQDCEALLSCLGTRASFLGWTPITFYEDSIKPITSAMRTANLKRLVCMTAACTTRTDGEPKIISYFLRPLFLGNTLKSMSVMEAYLDQECQDVDYTVVRPPGLANTPSSGKPVTAVEGQWVPNGSGRISRRDVAKFMLDTVGSSDWSKKCVAIAMTS
ncbi:hypothetical protein FSP39_022927 [Pinctada imbricata]|uniref:NAD(P)-binding domain-containing protein n=1 Tax=Pinctada imbricata TaxID=66713 RepID=A0AA89CAC6_PINIB|nr:hypothetical protein FSP39_022927 [Pinctada imbricata]